MEKVCFFVDKGTWKQFIELNVSDSNSDNDLEI